MSQEVVVSDREGVRWIELNRPQSRNGLTIEVIGLMVEALEAGEANENIRCLALAGAGGSFCSGLDLRSVMQGGPMDVEQLDANMRNYFHKLIRSIRAASKPTIAFVDGAAVGFGCDLALACDLRVLSDRARFGEIFVKRGLMPDGGSTFVLPRLVGLGRALDLMLTGDIVEAEEALRIGLGSRLFTGAEFEAGARDYAETIAAGPPLVHKAIKRSVAEALHGDLDAALDNERTTQMQLIQSRDFAEGVAAFFQKRPPKFQGK